ncbi:hypothetical protein NP493_95g04023 [Ridgeia piscesae]|uniref:IBR domain-containing protein n=1 Tax=Ridgeia piscesae TaxID=27915 RepID=A0AAD9UHM0_RIDPI|nr:hypothetical protein NP493_95g04023 [Ridgeia piscesae]
MHWLQCGYSPDDFIRPSTREHCPDTDPNDTDDEQLTCEETLTSRTYDYDLTAAFTKHHQRTENHPRTHSVNRANADGTHWSANTAAPLLKVHGKGTAIYEPRGTVSDVGEDSEVESLHESPFPRCFTPSPRSSSLVCRLRADGLDPAHLADLYGQHYAEGRCRPRRFTVNVAWLHATQTSQCGAAKGREVVLVFCIGRKVNRRSWVTDENSSVVLQDAVVSQYVRVQLESDLSTKQLLSEDLHATFGSFTKVHCLDDIIQLCVRHLGRWTEERTLVSRQRPSDPRSMCLGPTDQWPTAVNQDDCLVSYISRVCGWTIRIYDSEWDVLADAMARLEPDTLQDVVTRGHAHDHDTQDRGVLFEPSDQVESSDYCDLCRKSIDNDVHGIPQCTALATCCHWFCNECWKCHLAEKQGVGCTERVDAVTLLSVARLAVYAAYTRHVLGTSPGRSGDCQPCPRARCGRLARLESPSAAEGAGVVCTCGATWCFRCRRQVHWPASCIDMVSYEHIVQPRPTHDRRQNNSLPWNGGRTTSDVKSPNMGRSLRHQVAGRKWTSGHIHKKITTIINYHKIISQRTLQQQDKADLHRRTFDSLSTFAVQIHSVMECVYIFIDACVGHTRNRRLEKHVATLELAIDRMQRLLGEVRMDNIDCILTRLMLLKTQQKDAIKLIAHCVKETYTKLTISSSLS